MQYQSIATATPEEFIRISCAYVEEHIIAAVKAHGTCIIGFSGGSTPRGVYQFLGTRPLPWENIRCFLVDERYTSSDSRESNQQLLRSTLVMPGRITEENVVMPQTHLPIDACIEQYAMDLQELFAERLPDIVILGMGEDGHIASLFPPLSDIALGESALVLHTTTEQFAVRDRISVSLNMLAASGTHLFLLGKNKKPMWETMEKSVEDERRWPAKRVIAQGRTTVIWGP